MNSLPEPDLKINARPFLTEARAHNNTTDNDKKEHNRYTRQAGSNTILQCVSTRTELQLQQDCFYL